MVPIVCGWECGCNGDLVECTPRILLVEGVATTRLNNKVRILFLFQVPESSQIFCLTSNRTVQKVDSLYCV